MVIDARDRVRLPDRARQVTEAAQVGDVEHHDHVGPLDLAAGARRVVGAVGQEEVKPLGDRRGVRDGRAQPALGEEMPQRNLAPHPVSVGVHVRRERDTPSGPKHGGDGFGRADSLRRNGYAVGRHGIKINKGVKQRRHARPSRKSVARRRRANPSHLWNAGPDE